VVSRQTLIEARYPSVICAPVYSARHGLSTQVDLGIEEGLKHDSAAHCDELMSLPKVALTDYVGALPAAKRKSLAYALLAALELG
jgi:mRNA interferase MazF